MSSQSSQLVWLITGTSSGIGRELVIAALQRGEKVIATTRGCSISQLDGLKKLGAETLELDVTASIEELKEIAAKAINIYGRVDVLVNNAGYALIGAVEENTHEETLQQFNTNVFGALNVSRALLPYMRERNTGTIIFIGSLGGWRSGSPNAGIYAATKYAIRGLSVTLHDEIAPLGLRSICVEPGYFRTSIFTANNRSSWVPRIDDYREMAEKVEARLHTFNGTQAGGDTKKGAEVMVDIVRSEGKAAGKVIPKVIVLGSDCYRVVKEECSKTLDNLEEWKDVSMSTDF